MRVGPQDAAADVLHGVQQVRVIVPVDAHINATEHIAHEDGPSANRALKWPVRHLQFQNMIVMMMAVTPSLKASSRFLPYRVQSKVKDIA